MTGDADYLLRVVCADLAAYERFVLDHLTKVPGVASIRSILRLEAGEVFDGAAAGPRPGLIA